MKKPKLIITDLDGTLLRNNKTLSEYTITVLKKIKAQGVPICIATARGRTNAIQYIKSVTPDILISSGGALIQKGEKIISQFSFSAQDTQKLIATAFSLTDNQCEITVDTENRHYWNYNEDPHILSPDWGEIVYTDYSDFNEESLKICVKTENESIAKAIAESVKECNYVKFSDGDWYKYTYSAATKANAVKEISRKLNIPLSDMAAFGDDYVDIEMIKLCGIGIAVKNAIPEVKDAADYVTESNENDGVARFIEDYFINTN